MADAPIFIEPPSADQLDHLASLVQCPICYTVPRTLPVRACERGHVVCQICYNQMAFCGICRIPYLGANENIVASQLVSLLPFSCKHSAAGCPNRYLLEHVERHERVCVYQMISCPICNADLRLWNYNEHMTNTHTNHFYLLRQATHSAQIFFPLRPRAKCVRLQTTGDQTYFLHVKPLQCKISGTCQLFDKYHFALFASCDKVNIEGKLVEVDYTYTSRSAAHVVRVIFRKPVLSLLEYRRIKDETDANVFGKMFKLITPTDIQKMRLSFRIVDDV